jgi:hypothetical protein
VDAVGGLTYNKGSNVLTVLGQVSTQTLAVSGLATAPTAPNATSNNQIASTAFVNNQINQYANAVAITAGNIAVTNLTANTVTTGLWTIKDIGGVLYFQHTGGNVAKLESNGDFTTIGNVTGFGTL